jgi:hypothetical protein
LAAGKWGNAHVQNMFAHVDENAHNREHASGNLQKTEIGRVRAEPLGWGNAAAQIVAIREE